MTGPARPPSVVQRHQLATYVGLTFAVSWTIWLGLILGYPHIQTPVGAVLNVVAIAGPSIAAVVLATVLGRGVLRRLLAGFSRSRWSMRWTAVALVLPPAMVVTAIAVSVAAVGAPSPAVSFTLASVVLAEFVRVLLLGGPVGEELGWRGFALPRLQQYRTALDAASFSGWSGVCGIFPCTSWWGPANPRSSGVGAGPAFAIGGFLGWTIGLSVLFTWLFNQTGGSLNGVMFFHAAVNLAVILPAAVGSGGAAALLKVIITWLVAIGVVLRWGRARLVSPHRVKVATAR